MVYTILQRDKQHYFELEEGQKLTLSNRVKDDWIKPIGHDAHGCENRFANCSGSIRSIVLELQNIDHVQLAIPAGGEELAREFYGNMLGLTEVKKPENLQSRGGVWFANGNLKIHLGVDKEFAPAKKAHPAIRVKNLQELRKLIEKTHHKVVDDEPLPGYDRFYVSDPFGNRLEFLEPI